MTGDVVKAGLAHALDYTVVEAAGCFWLSQAQWGSCGVEMGLFGEREWAGTARWSSQVLLPQNEVYATKFAPHEALNLIARGELSFDERVVLHT